MRLYYASGSCSLAPHIALREAGLEVDLVPVNLKNHTLPNGGSFQEIQDLGYVPLLVLPDGTTLREGPAILQYIADLVPERGLAPRHGDRQRYRLQEWLNFLSTEIHKGCIPLFYAAPADRYRALAKRKLIDRYEWLNGALADKDYLLGNQFSVADCYLYALVNWAQADWLQSVYQLDVDLSGLSHLARWYKQVHGRRAVQQARAAEGLPH
jgi:glutathione S-transferase